MKLTIITALWNRHHLWPVLAAQFKRIAAMNGISLEVVIAGSEPGVSDAFATRHGYNYVHTINMESRSDTVNTLGRKWNAALQAAHQTNPDAVLALGQDDLCDNRYIELMRDRIESGIDFIGSLDCYFHNSETGETRYWAGYARGARKNETIGAGRCFSRRLLDLAGWRLWPDDRNGSLDYYLMLRIAVLRYRSATISCKAFGAVLLDVKDNESLTSWEKVTNAKACDLPPVFSDEEMSLLNATQQLPQ